MLLGIVLHAALSFAPIPWTVQDSQQSDFYYVLFACIHGFRMPLFFMLSGFFTAMLWRKRGLASLVKHRFKRIFLPLVIGCLTIVPAMWAVSYVVSRPSPGSSESSPLFAAVVSGDIELVRSELQNPDNGINTLDPNSGASPLCTAVFIGHTEIAELLVNADADVNLPNRALSTPLHIAVFMGRAKEAALLLKAGADVNARDGGKRTPKELLTTDFGTTNFIASSLGVPVNEEALLAGRKKIAELLNETEYLGSEATAGQSLNLEGLKGLLFQLPVFMHLWFLWFLCWLVAAFLIYAPIAKVFKIKNLPRWLVCSPISLLWLIPLTMLPQSFMASRKLWTGFFNWPDSYSERADLLRDLFLFRSCLLGHGRHFGPTRPLVVHQPAHRATDRLPLRAGSGVGNIRNHSETRGRIDERPGRQLSPSHIRLADDVRFDRPVASATVSRKPDFALHLGLVVLALPHPSATRDTCAVVGSRSANPGLFEIRCHHNRDLGYSCYSPTNTESVTP